MDTKKIFELLNEVINAKELKHNEIPDIDLYMDQVTSLMDDKLSSFKRNEEDQILTKTMINNYSKAKILMPSNKKKYSKEHTLLLVLIYHLKQTLSINDIESLFAKGIHIDNKNLGSYLSDIYEIFTDIQKQERENFKVDFEAKLAELKGNDTLTDEKSELLLALLTLIVKSSLQKRMAEKIIDEYFKAD